MLKTFVTLFRGAAAAAAEDVADRNALLILDQQMRDAAASVERAKTALAVAIAQDGQEGKRLEATLGRIADLEIRAVAALGGGREDLAQAAAEEIAALEAERAASERARAVFAAEIARLRRAVAAAAGRVAELERGRCIARAAEAARRLRKGRIETTSLHENSLAEAEKTLERLRGRQEEAEAADAALDRFDGAARSATLAERLADEGFGPRLRPNAADVLARLKARSAQGNPPTTA